MANGNKTCLNLLSFIPLCGGVRWCVCVSVQYKDYWSVKYEGELHQSKPATWPSMKLSLLVVSLTSTLHLLSSQPDIHTGKSNPHHFQSSVIFPLFFALHITDNIKKMIHVTDDGRVGVILRRTKNFINFLDFEFYFTKHKQAMSIRRYSAGLCILAKL